MNLLEGAFFLLQTLVCVRLLPGQLCSFKFPLIINHGPPGDSSLSLMYWVSESSGSKPTHGVPVSQRAEQCIPLLKAHIYAVRLTMPPLNFPEGS